MADNLFVQSLLTHFGVSVEDKPALVARLSEAFNGVSLCRTDLSTPISALQQPSYTPLEAEIHPNTPMSDRHGNIAADDTSQHRVTFHTYRTITFKPTHTA